MNSKGIRRITAATAPAVLLAGVVAGCTDSGSTAGASHASNSTSSAQDPAQTCVAGTDGALMVPGVVGSGTAKGNWGNSLTVSQDGQGSHGTVSMSVDKPITKKQPASERLRLKHGQVYLLVTVSVTYKSGGKSSVGAPYFVLRDAQNNACKPGSYNTVVPAKKQLRTVAVSKTERKSTGTLAYEVPAEQDYSKYTLTYGPADQKVSDRKSIASVAWTG